MKKTILFFLSILFVSATFSQIIDPVKWKFETKNNSKNKSTIIFTASIEKGWHLYGSQIPDGGPVPTSFIFTNNNLYKTINKIVETTKAEIKFDNNFGMDIPLHNEKAVFTQTIEIIDPSKDIVVNGTLEYMCCNDQSCLPPKQVEFSIPLKKDIKEQKTNNIDDISQTIDTSQQPVNPSEIGIQTTDSSLQVTVNGALSSDHKEEPESAWGFFWYALLMGLLGVLTPCVYPMIPMTVSFFMRGESKRTSGVVKGLIFGLSIVAIYTLIGVLVSLSVVNANVGNILSTHWIPNIIFFLLFIVFSASFFGMFEIVLPSSLSNKIDQQADRGGYIGSFFMALTLVIVSFSCTGPIVGKILIEASQGLSIKPIAGMMGYSLAFALPFTLFAIFPSMLKSLPKSGGWLNAIKVTLGFIIMAFSIKFLSIIDQTYHFGLLNRDLYLAIWIVLSILLGIYLLGKLRFSHDSPVEHVGFGRLIMAGSTFVFALYLFTGLLGAPLTAISSFIPPQENKPLVSNVNNTPTPSALCNIPKYSDILHLPHGLQGYYDYKEGYECAKKQNKRVLLDFKGHACSNCKTMESTVWSHPDVFRKLQNDYIIIALYVDDRTALPEKEWVTSSIDGKIKKTIGQVNADLQATLFKTNTQPYFVITKPDGSQIGQAKGLDTNIESYLKWLSN